MYDSTFSELQTVNKLETAIQVDDEGNEVEVSVLEHRISQSFKGDTVFLEVRYLGKKFTINKVFDSGWRGKELLEEQIKALDTVDKVKAYLNI